MRARTFCALLYLRVDTVCSYLLLGLYVYSNSIFKHVLNQYVVEVSDVRGVLVKIVYITSLMSQKPNFCSMTIQLVYLKLVWQFWDIWKHTRLIHYTYTAAQRPFEHLLNYNQKYALFIRSESFNVRHLFLKCAIPNMASSLRLELRKTKSYLHVIYQRCCNYFPRGNILSYSLWTATHRGSDIVLYKSGN